MIEIPDEQAESLRARAAAQGLTLTGWLERLANREPEPDMSSEEPLFQSVADIVLKEMRDVPPEMWDLKLAWTKCPPEPVSRSQPSRSVYPQIRYSTWATSSAADTKDKSRAIQRRMESAPALERASTFPWPQ